MKAFRLALASALCAFASTASAGDCTLHEVDKAERAKIKVFFTRFEKEDTSGGRYKTCRIVRTPEDGSTAFFVTPFRNQATVVVFDGNWPKR